MSMYLPIAEMATNPFVIVFFGALVGAMSGMFGVGGGFLMAPILFFLGIPPSVAVSTEATQICAASVSGSLAHFRRGNLDIKMGVLLTGGGLLGSTVGVFVFRWLVSMGSVDLVIQIFYVLFLGGVGGMMLVESLQAILRRQAGKAVGLRQRHGFMLAAVPHQVPALQALYLRVAADYRRRRCRFLSAIMGVGGGFIMVPAMIYLLGMPTLVVVGTSLFTIIFVTANNTLQHAGSTAPWIWCWRGCCCSVGIGAQIGVRLSGRFNAEQLRVLLAIIVLAVCIKILMDLLVGGPAVQFSFGQGGGGHADRPASLPMVASPAGAQPVSAGAADPADAAGLRGRAARAGRTWRRSARFRSACSAASSSSGRSARQLLRMSRCGLS